MSSILSPDSKLMTTLNMVGDLILANLLYCIMCVPIVTYGAAQSGMARAMRSFNMKEKRKSTTKELIEGFKSGFGKVTILSVIYLVALIALSYCAMYFYQKYGYGTSVMSIICYMGIAIILLLKVQMPLLNSQFDCSFRQLYQNSVFLMVRYPIRSIVIAILVDGPLALVIFGTYYYMLATPAFLFIYYSCAFLMATALTQPIFDRIIKKNEDDERIQKELEERQKRSI